MTTFDEYRQLQGVNASSLKWMNVSPKHYRHRLQNPVSDTPAMKLGRATHTAVLEPDRLLVDYTTFDGTRRGKGWDEFKAVNADKEILTVAEWADVVAIRDAVQAHPVAARYLADGNAEETITWTDDATGLPCKARLDFRVPQFTPAAVVDLKTARDIGDRAFGRQTHDLLYYMSAAHYLHGCRAVFGHDHEFVFIAVEANPPHDVRVGPLSEDAIYCGEQEADRLLRLVADCTASGEWPGAYPDEDTFDLPAWFYAQGERADTLALEGLTPKGDK